MRDLKDMRWILAKGFLFLVLGSLSTVGVLFTDAKPKQALFLAVTVWAFCRFYYFAFYVIEHYVDPTYRFAGLCSFAVYMLRKRDRSTHDPSEPNPPDNGLKLERPESNRKHDI